MDYTIDALNHSLELNSSLSEALIEGYMQIYKQFTGVVESYVYLLEAAEGNNNQNQNAVRTGVKKFSVRNIVEKIKEFFKRILGTFKEKARAIAKKNENWLDSNKQVFETMSYDGLQIEMIPFWEMDPRTIVNTVKNSVNFVANVVNGNKFEEKYKNIETVKKELFDFYLDEKGNISNGAKNYFRIGKSKNSDVKPVRLAGEDLKRRILNNFYPYCKTYETDIVNNLTNAINTLNNRMDAIINRLGGDNEATATKESFVDDGFINVLDFSILLEAERPAANAQNNNNNQNKSTNDQDDKPSPTEVKLQDNSNNAETKVRNAISDMSSNNLTIVKNILQCEQIVIAAALTAAEERFNAYMNAMRQIHEARKDTAQSQQQGEGNNQNNQKK